MFRLRLFLNGELGGKYDSGKGVGFPFSEILKQGDELWISIRSDAFMSLPTV